MEEPLGIIAGKVVALIKKGEDAQEKSEQYFKAAGIYIAECKRRKPAHVTWPDWCSRHLRISRSRADELIQIGNGTKTVEESRATKAASMRSSRAAQPPPRGGGNNQASTTTPRMRTLDEIVRRLRKFDQSQLEQVLRIVSDL